jgi:Xaa-Pro aminopeptidase
MAPLERLRNHLANNDISAILLSNLPSIQWLCGFTGSFAQVIVTPDSGVFLTDSRYTIQAGEQCQNLPVRSFASPQKAEQFLAEQVSELGLKQLAFDRNHVTVGSFEKWSGLLERVELVATDDPVDLLRMIKSADEVARIRSACELADAAVEMLAKLVAPGVREVELLWAFEDFLRQNGATSAFAPILVGGPNTARPHGVPGQRPFEMGDFVTFDLGARLDGYCSDITRSFVIGKATDRQREVYEHLLKAQVACIGAMKPGASGTKVDALAREILNEKDLARHFGHGLGHGLGALVHDTGRLSASVDADIEVGQVWTIEPGVYIQGFGGMRIEDDILITEDGCEVLTHFPKELIELCV